MGSISLAESRKVQTTLNEQTNKGTLSSLKRAGQFAQANPTVALKVPLSGFFGAVFGGGAGMAFGAAVAAITPIPSPLAIKAGGVIGAAAGGSLAAHHQIIEIQKSESYTAWQASVTKEVRDIFKKYLQENHLDQFFCPLSLDLINIPVRKKGGHYVFEFTEIVKCIELGGGEIECPMRTDKKIRLEDLEFYPKYHIDLIKKLASLLPVAKETEAAPQKSEEASIAVNVLNPSSVSDSDSNKASLS